MAGSGRFVEVDYSAIEKRIAEGLGEDVIVFDSLSPMVDKQDVIEGQRGMIYDEHGIFTHRYELVKQRPDLIMIDEKPAPDAQNFVERTTPNPRRVHPGKIAKNRAKNKAARKARSKR